MTNGWMIESLKKMGLTEYEAKTFIALNRIKGGTVSDINLTSDIPRAAIYSAMSKLEEKGLVEVEHGKPMRYRSIVPAKAINKLRDSINTESERVLNYLEEAYQEVESPEQAESMWTMRGVMNLHTKFSDLISNAKNDIILITTDPLFDELPRKYPVFNNIFPIVQRKVEEGVRVRLICTRRELAEYALSKVHGIDVRVPDPSKPSTSIQFKSAVLMTDGSEVLLSIISDIAYGDPKNITAIYTRLDDITSVFRHFMEVEWDSAIPLKA